MTASTLALRRRTHVERKVLSLLRGGDAARPQLQRRPRDKTRIGLAPPTLTNRCFSDLRHHAGRQGLRVQPPLIPYVSEAEIILLSWLAEAQRVAGPGSAPDDANLMAALADCAGLLNAIGLRLSPLTLYGARFHSRNY